MAIAEANLTEGPAPEEPATVHYWYLLGISGLISAGVGVLVLAYPDPSLKLLGVFLGIDLLLAGILMIVRGVQEKTDETGGVALILLGTLALIAGLVVIRNPGKSLVLLAMAFAIYLVVAGALALGRGIANSERRWATIGRGVVLVAVGTVIISWPDISLTTLAVLAGIGLVIQGAIEIGEAFFLRSLHRATTAR
jgi:uncharacterized membrane protein HdeD (DUF308 family)